MSPLFRVILRSIFIAVMAGISLYVLAAFGSFDTQEPHSQGPYFQAANVLAFEVAKEADATITGETNRDECCTDLIVGDLNGNGINDIILSAHHADLDGVFDNGGTFVFYDGLKSAVASFSMADLKIKGADTNDVTGSSLALGDLNNDGVADLVIGASKFSPSASRPEAGMVHILFGPFGTGTIDVSDASDVFIRGTEKNAEGASVAVGDMNNDGIDDLAFGAPDGGDFFAGEVNIMLGPIEAGTFALPDGVDHRFVGAAKSDHAGTRMAIGDVNGDSIDDLIVGTPFADPGGVSAAGIVEILFGPVLPGSESLVDEADITIRGLTAEFEAGGGIAIGDLNGDGVADLAVAAVRASFGGKIGTGRVHLIEGPAQSGTFDLDTAASLTIGGENSADRLGESLAIGDVNRDGINDLLMSAQFSDSIAENSGTTFIMFGNIFEREPIPDEPPILPIAIGFVVVVVVIGGVGFFIRLQRRPTSGPLA